MIRAGRALFCATLAGLLLESATAAAFCRSRTCKDTRNSTCERRPNSDCIVEGNELYRTSSCTSYAIERSGSALHDIDAERFDGLVRDAFDRWLEADCGGGRRPSLEVRSLGAVQCDEVRYNTNSGNASVFVFRDDWGLMDVDAYALTTVFFESTTGEIYDADVEINAEIDRLELDDPGAGIDLGSILTHEVGHFLGLAHSDTSAAVMRPYYTPRRDNLRILNEDDVAGICATYPPGRETKSDRCLPRHGFADACSFEPLQASGGCQAHGSAGGGGLAAALSGLALVLARLRRRSLREPPAPGRATRPR